MSKKTSSHPSKNKTARKCLSSRRSTHSVWVPTSSTLRSSALDKNTRADVCVVAGIAGINSAYLLARKAGEPQSSATAVP